MEGHRRYPDEPEPNWYSGQPPAETPNPYDTGARERPGGVFRLPEQRSADGYGPPDPMTTTGSHSFPPPEDLRIPVRGPEYPAARPSGATWLADTPAPAATASYGGPAAAVPSPGLVSNGPQAAAEPTAAVPPVANFAPPPETVYPSRRPASAIMIVIVAVLLMIPTVLLLVRVTFADDPTVRGIVPAVLLTLGLPLTAIGLHALAASGRSGREAWLRPPLAYLPVGLFLLLAAGLAVA